MLRSAGGFLGGLCGGAPTFNDSAIRFQICEADDSFAGFGDDHRGAALNAVFFDEEVRVDEQGGAEAVVLQDWARVLDFNIDDLREGKGK